MFNGAIGVLEPNFAPLEKRADVFAALQSDIIRLQGFKSISNSLLDVGLDVIKDSFPNRSFPVGAIHEFISARTEDAAASSGFIAGLLSSLMSDGGAVLWISSSRKLFPPALKNFGVCPERFLFIDARKEKDVLWAMDEALKCNALSAVVGEVKQLSFSESRRLQLAVEKSRVTGFVLHSNYNKRPTTTACISRWKITSQTSHKLGNLPGIGFPKWRVELLKIKNGKPGAWDIQWKTGRFLTAYEVEAIISVDHRKKVG